MRVRYKKLDNGKYAKSAEVYQAKEHGIQRQNLDEDAVRIVGRLQRHGFEAFIVGGAVRDLMFQRSPKDFDIATSAEPNQIKRLFRNSRIIGKRFRLVHIFFHDGKIMEVSTFRSADAEGFKNVFGTLEEDALRRDFSINALYYDPYEETVVDFVKGVRDIRRKVLKPVIPVKRIFLEDPVRMIRGVKYAASTGCRIPFLLSRRIRREASLLAGISDSRLSEEAFKLLQGGKSRLLFTRLKDYGLLTFLFPGLCRLLDTDPAFARAFMASLDRLDNAINVHNEQRRHIQLAYLLGDYVLGFSTWANRRKLPYSEVYRDVKDLMKPVTPPNIEVERALVYLGRIRDLHRKDLGLPDYHRSYADEAENRISRQDYRSPRPEDAPGEGANRPRPRRRRRRPGGGEDRNLESREQAVDQGGVD